MRPFSWLLMMCAALGAPATAWQRMRTNIAKNDFDVATDLYYINVSKQ
jgi:hypothetical protein